MAKGGSQKVVNETTIPAWAEDAAKGNIDLARQIAQLGYVPNYGPQVAAASPGQEAARAGVNRMASAFGMQGAPSYMPEPETFAGGVKGYSTAPLFEEMLERLKAERPGQYDAIMGMFIDPQTGKMKGQTDGNGGGGVPAGSVGETYSPMQQFQDQWRGDGEVPSYAMGTVPQTAVRYFDPATGKYVYPGGRTGGFGPVS